MSLVYCNNEHCLFCKKEYNGELVCTTMPFFVNGNKHTHANIITCGSFKERESSIIPYRIPCRDASGLYKGQIGYNPNVQIVSDETDAPDEVEECDT